MPVFSPDARCGTVDVEDALAAVVCSGSLGEARLVIKGDPFNLEQIRATLEFTPTRDFQFGQVPSDLVPFETCGNPADMRGDIEAAQRKLGHTVSLRIDGHAGSRAHLALVGPESATIQPRLTSSGGETFDFTACDDRLETWVPADCALLLGWEQADR